MTPRDFADVLLRKARNDLKALQVLAGDSEVADEIVGFEAQQAIEKALKAVLTAAQVRAIGKHSLDHLLERLKGAGIDIPDWMEGVTAFGPFAVTGRYVELDLDEPVDREAAIALVEQTLDWAADQVREINSA